jgi:hypothetical protein
MYKFMVYHLWWHICGRIDVPPNVFSLIKRFKNTGLIIHSKWFQVLQNYDSKFVCVVLTSTRQGWINPIFLVFLAFCNNVLAM